VEVYLDDPDVAMLASFIKAVNHLADDYERRDSR
jgi:hypothetical protein